MPVHPAQSCPPRSVPPTLEGKIVTPAHERFDEARRAWNLAVDQRPAAVVLAESAQDVAAAVAFARENGLRVAPQGTGHNAAALGSLDDTILLKTERMRGVPIDPEARIARVEAGVALARGRRGRGRARARRARRLLAGRRRRRLHARRRARASSAASTASRANNVRAIELVTADGRLVRADRDDEPDLFWALRGGGGSFGVVTAIEFELFPIEQVYAGILWFPIERAGEVLHAWRELTPRPTLPDELTHGRPASSSFPPIPEIPEPVRGKSFVDRRGRSTSATRPRRDELLAPLRALGPVMTRSRRSRCRQLSHLHMDPEHPVPGVGDGLTARRAAGARRSTRSSRSPAPAPARRS